MAILNQIKKPFLYQLYKRFNVSQAGEKLFLSDKIVPVIDVDNLTKRLAAVRSSVTAVSDTLTLTCPANKVYYLVAVTVERAQGGPIVVEILTPSGAGTSWKYQNGGSDTLYNLQFPQGVFLIQGDAVTVTNGTGTSGTIESVIWYMEADA